MLEPGLTKTNMPKGLASQPFCDSADKCVEGALRDLGNEKVSPGAFVADLTERMLFMCWFFIR